MGTVFIAWTGSIVACAQLNSPADNLDCEPKK
jgi:hypothetical protein